VLFVISFSPKKRNRLQFDRPANAVSASSSAARQTNSHRVASCKPRFRQNRKCLKLDTVMPEQQKGFSLSLMLAVLGIALLIATAIAYGIIGKFFHS
jgi:hypothetical protein